MSANGAGEGQAAPKKGRSPFLALALVLLGALALLLPAIANGYPFLFFDTKIYGEVGKSAVTHIVEIVKPEAAPPPEPATAPAGPAAAPAGEEDDNGSMTYAGGRSPYYSAFIYLSDLAGPLWIVAFVQSLMAAWVLYVTARGATPDRPTRTYGLLIGGLTLASSLPYYTDFAMPDVMTGIAILATAVLAIWLKHFTLLERLGLVVVAAFAAAAHGTNPPLTALALIMLGLIVILVRPNLGSLPQRAAWAVTPLILAVVAGFAYSTATGMVTGEKPRSPPYLMARVLADGTGLTYLNEVCANGEPFEICRYKDQGFRDHNDILWSTDPKYGVVQLAPMEARRKFIEQQKDFVVQTVAAHPWEQLAISARNSFKQFFTFTISVEHGLAKESWDEVQMGQLMPTETAAATHALAYRQLFPFKIVDAVQTAALIASLSFLVWRLTRADALAAYRKPSADDTSRSLTAFAGVGVGVVLLLIANAILCGTLSGVHDRYMTRMIWLLPLTAILLYARFGRGDAKRG